MPSNTESQNRFLNTISIVLSIAIKKISESNPINSITNPKLPPPLKLLKSN